MAGVLIFIIAILKIASFSRKNELNNEINNAALIRFLIFGFVYFVASQIPLIKYFDYGCYGYQDFFLAKRITLDDLKDLMDAPKRFLIIPFVPFAIVFCMGVVRFFKPRFDNIVTRFSSAILLAIPLGLATLILQGHAYIKYLPIIIFLLFAFKYSFIKITISKIFKAFAGFRDEEISFLRNNLFKFALTGFILCWFGLTLLAYPAKKAMDEKPTMRNVYSYSFTNDHEKAYQYILEKMDDANLSKGNVLRCIPLIRTDDLPAVIDKLKNRKFHPYGSYFNFSVPEQKKYDELDERSITYLLMTAGRDQMPIILKYLNNPDNGIALIFRAQLGDKSVKDKLQNILRRMIADPNQAEAEQRSDCDFLKPSESQVVLALASISEPDEAFEMIRYSYKKHMLKNNYPYFNLDSFCTLSKEVVIKIYNLYLNDLEKRIEDSNENERYIPLSPFMGDSEGLYFDDQISAKILNLFLRIKSCNQPIGRLGIEYHLTSDSQDLLLKGLQSQNDELRAWSLCQLRKIEYKFSEDQLKTIAADKSWKVRANLALIDKSHIKNDDPSSFVKLCKSLSPVP